MYKTIVVGTDGSDRAQIAVDHAIALARALGSQVHFVHARRDRLSRDPSTMDAAARAQLEIDQSYDQGDALTAAALARAEAQGVQGHAHNPRGDPADTLIAIAEAQGADLIVVGNQGMGGLRRFALGNVPNRISHRCPCNLLIVDTEGEGHTKAAQE